MILGTTDKTPMNGHYSIGTEKGELMKLYIVVYLSAGGMHYRYRCSAKDKREARKMCRHALGITDKEIVEVEEELL